MVTGHYLDSKRKAGFHHLANAFAEQGHEVLFFTAPISKLHKLKRDHLFQYPIEIEANKITAKGNILSYLYYTPFHLANTKFKLTNLVSSPLSSIYSNYHIQKEAEDFIATSDYIIFESTPGLFLFDRFRILNSKAKFIYRVSDDLRFLQVHPAVIKYEDKIISKFDLVSIVSSYFSSYFKTPNVKLRYNAINKQIFDQQYQSPYPAGKKNLLFIGNANFDAGFLEIASSLFPDLQFHIIGPIPETVSRNNIKYYGEIPFAESVKFIKHADLGLHTITYKKGAESMTDALKALQYTYAKIPIVAPEFLKNSRPHTFYYSLDTYKEESIREAIINALNYPIETISSEGIMDWKELASNILED